MISAPFILLSLVLAAILTGRAVPWPPSSPASPPETASPSVPVVTALARKQDVPIILSGIGAVAALNIVTVRSRVEGELLNLRFQEGQMVAAGDILAQVDPRPYEATLRQMIAALRRDQARLTSAAADLERFSTLARNSFASRQSVETQQSAVGQIEADLESDQAQIDNARLRLLDTTIRSPIAGRVGFRVIDAGNMVNTIDRSAIVVVTQQQPIGVVFSLPEQELGPVNQRLMAGQALSVTVSGRDDQSGQTTGVVATIDSAIDQRTATFKVKAVFANEDRRLWPGQFVRVRLLLTTRRDALVVQAEAVQRGPDGPLIYVVSADQRIEARRVTLGQMSDGLALIERGLEPNERVVIEGQNRLRAGTLVHVIAADAP